jgi:hypothetical protein
MRVPSIKSINEEWKKKKKTNGLTKLIRPAADKRVSDEEATTLAFP